VLGRTRVSSASRPPPPPSSRNSPAPPPYVSTDDEITVHGEDEAEDRNSGLPPLPSVRSAFMEQGWSSRPPPVGPPGPAAAPAPAIPKAAAAPAPPPAFPPPSKTLAGLPLPPAVKWTPEKTNESVQNHRPSSQVGASQMGASQLSSPVQRAEQVFHREPSKLPPPAAAVPARPASVRPAAPPFVPGTDPMEAALFPNSRPPAVQYQEPIAESPTPSRMPPVATVPFAAPVVGSSVEVDEFLASSRKSKWSPAGWFSTKPGVAAIFFGLGVLVTLGVQIIVGIDSSSKPSAALSPVDQQAEAKTRAAQVDQPQQVEKDKLEELAARKALADDKAAGRAQAGSSEEPSGAQGEVKEAAEDEAQDEPSSTAGKTTKSGQSTGGKFSTAAANKAMSNAAAQASHCQASGKGGPAKVRVTFATSGKASLVQVILGRFDSKTLGCIKNKFQAARVPAFSGKAESVNKSFTVK